MKKEKNVSRGTLFIMMADFFFEIFEYKKGLEFYIFDGTLLTKMMQEVVF